MKIETREIYKCDHCNKLYQIKRFAEYHEKICRYNPANNRPCYDCTFLTKKAINIESDTNDRVVNLFFCTKKETFIYTPKNGIKGNIFDLGHNTNSPMPIGCDLFDGSFQNIFE